MGSATGPGRDEEDLDDGEEDGDDGALTGEASPGAGHLATATGPRGPLYAAALEADPTAEVDSPVLQLGSVQQTFDVLLAVVDGMQAVAVAIALVGMTNTLSLSLTERRQENALLRALGLSRSRLRAVVAREALVLGVTVGAVLGTGFGVAGTYSVIGGNGTTVVGVRWSTLVGLAAVVASVAVGASLWPTDRASRVAPASASGAAA